MRAGGAEKAQKGYCTLEGLGHDRVFWLCVVTWFLGCRRLLGRDKGFPSLDRVVFLLFFYRDRGPHGVATVFCFLS